MTIPELIKEAKDGSIAAQQLLFDQLSPKLLILCRRYVKNAEDAEERMLDGFYKFFTNLQRFNYQNDSALLSWLKRIMINECLMQLRKKNVFNIVAESLANELSLDEDILDQLSADEIFGLIIQLPVGYRTVFNLYVIEGFDHKEIAAMLNISEGTSKSQLSKSRSLLQKMLLSKGNDHARQQSK